MLRFIKMHGLGNDFVFIDTDDFKGDVSKNFITKISDRKIGIGCDQLIFYGKLSDDLYSMKIYNPDGSQAGMCGNATRCLGLIAFEKCGTKNLKIKVNNRIVSVNIESSDLIKVNMGKPDFEKSWMPKISQISEIIRDYQLNLKEIVCVDMGNPHIVIFYSSLGRMDKSLLGQRFQIHPAFPDGVNVNFARIDDDQVIHLTVFERGTSLTLACGSGACATFAAANKLKFIQSNATIKFEIGNLDMSYLDEDIIMSGPATKVATGFYYG
jgi:diaminopimelate epimerase